MDDEFNGMGPEDAGGEEALSGLANGVSSGVNSAQSLAHGIGNTVNRFRNSGKDDEEGS